MGQEDYMGLNSDADKQGDHSVVSPDAVLAPGDRMLTAKESLVLERSGTVAMGKWADGDMAPQTLWEARAKVAELHLLKRQATALADLEAFVDAHREQAHRIYGAKLGVILGLLDEMVVTEDDGTTRLATEKVDDKRLKVLLQAVDQFEKRAFGNPTQKTEVSGSVDVRHVVANLKQQLTS